MNQTEAPASVSKRSLILRAVVSLFIAGCLFWLLREAGLHFVPPADALAKIDRVYLGLFLALWLVGMTFRVYRWTHLLRPIDPTVPVGRTMGMGLLGFSALFAPMRMGEFVRPVLIARDKRIGFVQGLGTVAVERIVDGLCIAGMLLFGLWVTEPSDAMLSDQHRELKVAMSLVPGLARAFMAIFTGALTAMVLFYYWRSAAHRLVETIVGSVSKRAADFLVQQLDRLSDSLGAILRSPRHALAFLRDTFGLWFASVLSTFCLIHAVGAPPDLIQASVILGVLGLGTALPGPPGFYGTYQIGAYCGIAMFYPTQVLTAGAVFTFVSYCTQLVTALVSLPLGLWVLSVTRRPEPQTDPKSSS